MVVANEKGHFILARWLTTSSQMIQICNYFRIRGDLDTQLLDPIEKPKLESMKTTYVDYRSRKYLHASWAL